MIKAIIFDLDHTLFDRYATLTEVAKMLRSSYLPVNPELDDKEIADIMIHADKTKVYYGWECLREYIVNETNLFTQKIKGTDYSDFVFKCSNCVAVPFDFTLPTLKGLKKQGYMIGLITNGLPGLQQNKLKMLGIDNIFDRVLVSGEYNCPKPQLRGFELMSEWLNLDPSQMMYVGDHPVNDVFASRRANYTPVWVRIREEVGEVCECEYSVKDVSEIPALVDKING
jgi:putative hydrolase of the HAD superfamily